jgi:hypothetical protein
MSNVTEDTIGELSTAKAEFKKTNKVGDYFVKIHAICSASQNNKMYAKQFYNDEIRHFMQPAVREKFTACAAKYGFPLQF